MGDENKRKRLHTRIRDIHHQALNQGDRLNLMSAKESLVSLGEFWEQFQEEQEKFFTTATTDEAHSIQFAYETKVLDLFSGARAKLREIIEGLTAAAAAATTRSTASAATTPQPPPAATTIKLPTISVPVFEGSFNDWLSFKDLFQAAVHSNGDLTDAQRLQYLKGFVRGEPANLIKSFTTTDASYGEAWTILESRYDNKREIVHSLIKRLLEIRPIRGGNARDLQQLVDGTNECLRSLRVQGCPVDKWDDLLVVITTMKMDPDSRREWAKTQTTAALPTMKTLQGFLESHIRGLIAAGGSSYSGGERRQEKVKVNHAGTSQSQSCEACSEGHCIQQCPKFLSKSPNERSLLVKQARLCFNCLRRDHMSSKCPSGRKCKVCQRRHHTLLHEESRQRSSGDSSNGGNGGGSSNGGGSGRSTPAPQPANEGGTSGTTTVAAVSSNNTNFGRKRVVLKVIAHIQDKTGSRQQVRVFLDPGSEGDFITESCVNRLGLRRRASRVIVSAFGEKEVGVSKGEVTAVLSSVSDPDVSLNADLLVMPSLTGKLPSVRCRHGGWDYLNDIRLSDPEWYKPTRVDILLGVGYFERIMRTERRRGRVGEPFAWNTIFGWAVGGDCPAAEEAGVASFHITVDPIQQQLKKFWEIEEPPRARLMTQEEKEVEQHFQQTYSRNKKGKFVVAIPFNDRLQQLGRSRDIAVKRLLQVERRLAKNPHLQQQYVDFMKEYRELGHMRKAKEDEKGEQLGVTNYLCLHFVQNDSSTTTKLRVVFDGSQPTSSGVSFNEVMKVGAVVQDNLYDQLLRSRMDRIFLKGDIKQMFRMFLLREADAQLHRIVWRDSPKDPIEDYILCTVTYGTAYAPNLATRSLHQLGLDTRDEFPLASHVLLQRTYVDDAMGGGESVEEVKRLYQELTAAVASAGMEMRKWTSNSSEVMEAIPEELRDNNPLTFQEDKAVKTLGVQWCPRSDNFLFTRMEFQSAEQLTKRKLLSEISRIFDPLGLISCVTLRGKMLLQELWKDALGWDEEVPERIASRWDELRQDLELLDQVKFPRLIISPNAERLELVGFCDSSEAAYGAIVYMRCTLPNGEIQVNFVTSKTHVAPLKLVTLPRLELQAAVLLAELIVYVKETLKLDVEMFCYSDSTITLRWIAAEPRRWKTYVGNRVAAIQELVPAQAWQHIAGVENPADLASRGCSVRELMEGNLWSKGARLLQQQQLPQFSVPQNVEFDMEERVEHCESVSVNRVRVVESVVLTRFSDLKRLKRSTAWYFRFLLVKIGRKRCGPLTATEVDAAFMFWVRRTQQQHFGKDVTSLKLEGRVGVKSQIKCLFPFLDSSHVLRVSGRLNNSSLPETRKHQIILPAWSHLTKLLIRQQHEKLFHGGFQVTMATLQAEYWIVHGRSVVRSLLRSCVRCQRFKKTVAQQLMGDLPRVRVTPSRCFEHTGMDFAGPFMLKNPIGRAPKTYKGYIAIFVCLVTKAIHMEVASGLTTEAFLAVLRRFVSIRGLCSHVYSDNGTNFVGAEREIWKLLNKDSVEKAAEELSERGVEWHFNPPASPHRGGLWEAGVKSAKYHLRRVVGNVVLTFEQFHTIITQISAVLNSRPLYPRSADPADLEPLTPGHFLIGAPLVALPDRNVEATPINRLNLYQQQQQRLQLFWRRWTKEYLNTLQQRNKWVWDEPNLEEGRMVMLAEETSPGNWKMGRVVKVHPGGDGRVRVVDVRTATGVLQRPIAKLVPLLCGEEMEDHLSNPIQ